MITINGCLISKGRFYRFSKILKNIIRLYNENWKQVFIKDYDSSTHQKKKKTGKRNRIFFKDQQFGSTVQVADQIIRDSFFVYVDVASS